MKPAKAELKLNQYTRVLRHRFYRFGTLYRPKMLMNMCINKLDNHTCVNCANNYSYGCEAPDNMDREIDVWIAKNWDYQKQCCKEGANNCPRWRLKK